jgi:hypothetical protein
LISLKVGHRVLSNSLQLIIIADSPPIIPDTRQDVPEHSELSTPFIPPRPSMFSSPEHFGIDVPTGLVPVSDPSPLVPVMPVLPVVSEPSFVPVAGVPGSPSGSSGNSSHLAQTRPADLDSRRSRSPSHREEAYGSNSKKQFVLSDSRRKAIKPIFRTDSCRLCFPTSLGPNSEPCDIVSFLCMICLQTGRSNSRRIALNHWHWDHRIPRS